MKIILLTNSSFLSDDLKTISNIIIIKNIESLLEHISYETSFILLHHLDDDENVNLTYTYINENFSSFKLVALRNSPNKIEGCMLLKKNYKAYAHSLSNNSIIKNIISTVNKNEIWVYPELMQFLISSVPLTSSNNDKLLNKITAKELEVLELLSQGNNNLEISTTLDIAVVTVKKHVSSLFKKLDFKDRLSLAMYYNNYK